MKEDLKQILNDIFTSSQYNIIESNNYDLIASRNNYNIYINIGDQAEYQKIRKLSNEINGNNQDGNSIGIYVVTDNPDERLYQYADKMGIILWGRDQLALQIGKAVIADIEGGPCNLELVQPYSTAQSSQEYCNDSYYDYSVLNDTTSEPVEQNTEQETVKTDCLNIKTAPINTSKDSAVSIAKAHLGKIQNATLKFVPYWKYNYSVNTEQNYKSKTIDISAEDTGYLNALNGSHESLPVEKIIEYVEEPEYNYYIVSNSLTREEASSEILKNIIEKNTKNIRFDKTAGEAIISEHKRFKPKSSDIDYNLELVYLPVWEVKDKRNSIEINGHNSEVFSKPTGNDVEFM